MDHNGNSDSQFPTSSRPLFFKFFVFVPTVLLEERARTFQDALYKLYEDQSAAEYVEHFNALEKLLANSRPTTTPTSGFPLPTRPWAWPLPRPRHPAAVAAAAGMQAKQKFEALE